VAEGQMPMPKRVGARKIYDRAALDTFFAALPEEAAPEDGNPWDNL
jgi:hypothetical protein